MRCYGYFSLHFAIFGCIESFRFGGLLGVAPARATYALCWITVHPPAFVFLSAFHKFCLFGLLSFFLASLGVVRLIVVPAGFFGSGRATIFAPL